MDQLVGKTVIYFSPFRQDSLTEREINSQVFKVDERTCPQENVTRDNINDKRYFVLFLSLTKTLYSRSTEVGMIL